VINFAPPIVPPPPPPLTFGDARKGDSEGLIIPSLSRDHSPREALRAQRGGYPWITSIALRGRFTLGLCHARQNNNSQCVHKNGIHFL